ncbi:hypothetical protein D3C87_2053950 [compost metagenome]
MDEEFISDLILKSGINEDIVRKLIEMINRLKGAVVIDDDALIQLHKLIEKFYKQAQ